MEPDPIVLVTLIPAAAALLVAFALVALALRVEAARRSLAQRGTRLALVERDLPDRVRSARSVAARREATSVQLLERRPEMDRALDEGIRAMRDGQGSIVELGSAALIVLRWVRRLKLARQVADALRFLA